MDRWKKIAPYPGSDGVRKLVGKRLIATQNAELPPFTAEGFPERTEAVKVVKGAFAFVGNPVGASVVVALPGDPKATKFDVGKTPFTAIKINWTTLQHNFDIEA